MLWDREIDEMIERSQNSFWGGLEADEARLALREIERQRECIANMSARLQRLSEVEMCADDFGVFVPFERLSVMHTTPEGMTTLRFRAAQPVTEQERAEGQLEPGTYRVAPPDWEARLRREAWRFRQRIREGSPTALSEASEALPKILLDGLPADDRARLWT